MVLFLRGWLRQPQAFNPPDTAIGLSQLALDMLCPRYQASARAAVPHYSSYVLSYLLCDMCHRLHLIDVMAISIPSLSL